MSVRQVDRYYLPQDRLEAVRAYARQYPGWMEEYHLITHTSKAQRLDQVRSVTGVKGKPTEKLALRRVELSKKITLIDSTARECDPFICQYLIKGVTQKKATYEKLHASGMHCSRGTYYDRRRAFYYKLSKKLEMIGI